MITENVSPCPICGWSVDDLSNPIGFTMRHIMECGDPGLLDATQWVRDKLLQEEAAP